MSKPSKFGKRANRRLGQSSSIPTISGQSIKPRLGPDIPRELFEMHKIINKKPKKIINKTAKIQ